MRVLLQEKAGFVLVFMARMLDVSTAGYYAWLSRPVSARDLRAARLAEAVQKAHADSDGVYGSPRVLAELRDAGWEVSRKSVAKTMNSLGIQGLSPRSFVTTTVRDGNDSYPADLVERRWDRGKVDRVWIGDITYLRQGFSWIYLATVIDAHSKRVIGFATADHMRADLVQAALQMACDNRPGRRREVIFHSDSETVLAGVPRVPDPHSDGHDRMLVPGAPMVPDPHSDRRSLSCPGSVGSLGAPGEALRLTVGVT